MADISEIPFENQFDEYNNANLSKSTIYRKSYDDQELN